MAGNTPCPTQRGCGHAAIDPSQAIEVAEKNRSLSKEHHLCIFSQRNVPGLQPPRAACTPPFSGRDGARPQSSASPAARRNCSTSGSIAELGRSPGAASAGSPWACRRSSSWTYLAPRVLGHDPRSWRSNSAARPQLVRSACHSRYRELAHQGEDRVGCHLRHVVRDIRHRLTAAAARRHVSLSTPMMPVAPRTVARVWQPPPQFEISGTPEIRIGRVWGRRQQCASVITASPGPVGPGPGCAEGLHLRCVPIPRPR